MALTATFKPYLIDLQGAVFSASTNRAQLFITQLLITPLAHIYKDDDFLQHIIYQYVTQILMPIFLLSKKPLVLNY